MKVAKVSKDKLNRIEVTLKGSRTEIQTVLKRIKKKEERKQLDLFQKTLF